MVSDLEGLSTEKEGYVETKEAKRVAKNRKKRHLYRIASILFPILVLLTYLVVWITGWHLQFVVFVLLFLIFVFCGIEHWCNRCPHCESFLSRSPFFAKNCPYCGKDL